MEDSTCIYTLYRYKFNCVIIVANLEGRVNIVFIGYTHVLDLSDTFNTDQWIIVTYVCSRLVQLSSCFLCIMFICMADCLCE